MKISPLLVLAVLFISGCIGTTAKVDINNGVVIEKFTADPKDVFDFQTVTFSVDVSNVGGTTAKNGKVKLLGAENIFRTLDNRLVAESDATKPPGAETITLNPPVVKENRLGDSRFFDFNFNAPDLNEGDRTSFSVKARVEFDYSTTGSVIVKALSFAQQQIIQKRGESILNPVTESNSEAPIKFVFVRGPTPLVIDPDEDISGRITRELRFEIVNVGQGWPVTDRSVGLIGGSLGSRIDVSGPGVTPQRCEGIVGSNEGFSVILRSNGKASISCPIQIDLNTWRTRTEASLVFKVTLNYRYFVEKEVSVAVQGTKRADVPARPAPGAAPPAPGVAPGATPVPGVPAGAPTIVSTNPSTGATNVPVATKMDIVFNKPIDINSIASSIVVVKATGGGGQVTGSISLGTDSKTVSFTPVGNLEANSRYTVTVSTSIRSTDGFNLASPLVFSFDTVTVAVDITAPTLFSPSPALDAVVNSRTVSLSLSTNEAATCKILATGETLSTTDGRAHSLVKTNLADGQHTFVIRCKDAANNELAANDLTIRFIIDATAPTVSSTTPVATPQQTGVSRTAQIIITFSEPMDTASVDAAFSISPTVAGTKTFNAQHTQLFFTPSAAMAASAEHTVTISTGAKDKANNPLAQAFTFKFTTGA